MWEGIRFSKSGCTSARTKINGQIHKDVETREEVSESRFSMLASDHAKCAQEIPLLCSLRSTVQQPECPPHPLSLQKSTSARNASQELSFWGPAAIQREGLQRRKLQRRWKITGI